jgi:choline dehydrogenase-like flavoprotein
MSTYSFDDDRVVVVVGTGAGGATLAKTLCDNSINVVALEAGPYIASDDFVQDEWTGYEMLRWEDERIAAGSWKLARDHPANPVWHCKVVGGSTVHWLGVSLRMLEHEFSPKTTYGAVAGANLQDWAISLAEIEPYYDKAEKIMGVTGTNDLPRLPITNNYKVMHAGAIRAGYKRINRGRLAINASPYDSRPASRQDGFTVQGDRSQAKWCTSYIEIPRALATGRLDLRANARAVQVEHDRSGRVSAVVYVDGESNRYRQRCTAAVIACNSIESPRLLLHSASGRFPNGLANGSGHVGRHYMRHVMGTVWSVFDKPVRHYRGESMPGLVADEVAHDPARGFVGGYYIELNAISLPAIAMLLQPGLWGSELTWALERYGNMAGLIAVGEDMPRETNAITLHPNRVDKFGVPLAVVSYDDHPNDVAMRNHAYKAMTAVHKAAGAVRCYESPPFPATHNLGTLRMSAHPADGVVDRNGKAHEFANLFAADGSVFTSSGAANPTLTIVALALRQGEHLAGLLRHSEL